MRSEHLSLNVKYIFEICFLSSLYACSSVAQAPFWNLSHNTTLPSHVFCHRLSPYSSVYKFAKRKCCDHYQIVMNCLTRANTANTFITTLTYPQEWSYKWSYFLIKICDSSPCSGAWNPVRHLAYNHSAPTTVPFSRHIQLHRDRCVTLSIEIVCHFFKLSVYIDYVIWFNYRFTVLRFRSNNMVFLQDYEYIIKLF